MDDISEEEKFDLFLNGLLPEYIKIVKLHDLRDILQIINFISQYEEVMNRIDKKPYKKKSSKKKQYIYESDELDNVEIIKVKKKKNSKPKDSSKQETIEPKGELKKTSKNKDPIEELTEQFKRMKVHFAVINHLRKIYRGGSSYPR